MTTTARNSFTSEAWARIEPWRQAVETMPFIVELADGSLPAGAFGFYLSQDAVYLIEFARALARASQLSPTREAQNFYAGSAHTALVVESSLHHTWLAEHAKTTGTAEPSPVTAAYTDHLLAIAGSGSYARLAAAVLPCYWLYAHIGDVLQRLSRDVPDHPYRAWIDTYSDPAFQQATQTARDLTDAAADTADDQERAAMFRAFEISSAHEYHFFDQGLTQPAWPTPPSS